MKKIGHIIAILLIAIFTFAILESIVGLYTTIIIFGLTIVGIGVGYSIGYSMTCIYNDHDDKYY